MKISILVLAIAASSILSIPAYAKDEMAMPMPVAKTTTQKDIIGKGAILLFAKCEGRPTS